MTETKVFNHTNKPSATVKSQIINFLYSNLEQYGDEKSSIEKAIDYSLGENNSKGGATILLYDNQILKGAVVINKTGMGGYIPENILVYIAKIGRASCRERGEISEAGVAWKRGMWDTQRAGQL